MDEKIVSRPLFPKSLHIAKVIAPMKYKRDIIREVEKLEKVEPIMVDPRTGIDQIHVEDKRNRYEGFRTRLNGLLGHLDPKKISSSTKLDVGMSEEDVTKFIEEVLNEKGARLAEIADRNSVISTRIAELEEIKSLLVRLNTLNLDSSMISETRHTQTFFGSIYPPQIDRLLWTLDEITDGKYFYLGEENISKNQDQATILVSVLQRDAEVVMDKLKSMSVQEVAVPQGVDFEMLDIAGCEIEQGQLATEQERLNLELDEIAKEIGHYFRAALEVVGIELNRIAIELKMRRTESTCVLWAWIPEDTQAVFTTNIMSVTNGTAVVDFKKGDFDPENIPGYTTNSEFMTPVRGVVSAFGSPSTKEIDPFPFVKYLMPLFFGIMFADVGHGFVFMMFGILMKRKKDKMEVIPDGLMGYIYGGAELIILMGLFAMLIGIPMNSLFGDETILWRVGLFRFLFEKTTWAFFFTVENGHIERNYFNFLIFSCALGALIILLGLGLNIYKLTYYRHGDAEYQAAIALFTGYFIIIIAAILLAAQLTTFGLILLGIAFILLIATIVIEGRAHGVDGIMLAFDHILSLMSNTLSFGRLLAMNTVHFVLAFLPYLFIDLWWKPILNHSIEHWIPSDLIPIWILAAVIGAVVVVPVEGVFSTLQALRLNWVEFFGKFYTGSGREFKPVIAQRIFTVEMAQGD